MPFVLVLEPLDLCVGRLHRFEEFAAVEHRHAAVDAAVGQQQRRLDACRLLDRRGRLQLRRVLDLVADQVGHAVLLPLRSHVRGEAPVAVVEQVDVGNAHPADAALVQVGVVHQPHQGGVAAVAGAGDADALRIGVAMRHGPAGAVGDVVLHLQAPLLPAGAEVLVAIAGAAAEVRLQHRIAARSQELGFRVPAPVVAMHVRPAMHQHHQRRILRAACRQGQQRGNLHAVARLVAHRVLAPHARRVDARISLADQVQFAGPDVVQVIEGRLFVGIRAHQRPFGVVPGREGHQIDRAGQGFVELLLHRLHRRVEPDRGDGIGAQPDAEQLVAAADERTREIVAGRDHERLGAQLAGGGVDGEDAGGVLAAVGHRVQGAVAAEAERLEGILAALVSVEGAQHAPGARCGFAVPDGGHAFFAARGQARLALVVEHPAGDPGRPLHGLGGAGEGIQLQQVHGADVVAVFRVLDALDVDKGRILGAALVHHEGMPGQHLACDEGAGRLDGVAAAVGQLAQVGAVLVDRVQPGRHVGAARRHLAVGHVEEQAAVVDPFEVEDVGILVAGHRLGAIGLQVDHHQDVAPPGCARYRRQVARARRQLGAGQHRIDEEAFDRRQRGCGG